MVNERIATLTVTKKDKFIFTSTPTGVKIFRIKKNQSELSIINVHVRPHETSILPRKKLSNL